MTAHLQRNEGDFLDRMSPFVIIKINGFEVFRNEPNYQGGKNPQWGPMRLEHMVLDVLHECEIMVLDKDMIGADMIGHAKVPLNFFCRPGEMNEWLELKFGLGFDAGRIHMRSEYIPEAAMAGGMGGGMAMEGGKGGMGVGGALVAGAAIGTLAAIDIAEHDHRRRGPEVVVVNEHHGRHHHDNVVVVETHGRHHGRR